MYVAFTIFVLKIRNSLLIGPVVQLLLVMSSMVGPSAKELQAVMCNVYSAARLPPAPDPDRGGVRA